MFRWDINKDLCDKHRFLSSWKLKTSAGLSAQEVTFSSTLEAELAFHIFFYPSVIKARLRLLHIHINLWTPSLAFCGNNRIVHYEIIPGLSVHRAACQDLVQLKQHSMWCELINIIDATKAARLRLQAEGKEPENGLSSFCKLLSDFWHCHEQV